MTMIFACENSLKKIIRKTLVQVDKCEKRTEIKKNTYN